MCHRVKNQTNEITSPYIQSSHKNSAINLSENETNTYKENNQNAVVSESLFNKNIKVKCICCLLLKL